MEYTQELISSGIEKTNSLTNDILDEEDLEILKSLDSSLSSEEMKVIITEIKFLTGCWIDEYEKNIFNGLTLRELLIEKDNI